MSTPTFGNVGINKKRRMFIKFGERAFLTKRAVLSYVKDILDASTSNDDIVDEWFDTLNDIALLHPQYDDQAHTIIVVNTYKKGITKKQFLFISEQTYSILSMSDCLKYTRAQLIALTNPPKLVREVVVHDLSDSSNDGSSNDGDVPSNNPIVSENDM